MAPVRSTNRRNAPVSPAKSVTTRRTTRATRNLRSQSKDIEDTDGESEARRSASTDNVPTSTKLSKTSRRKGKGKIAGGLSFVEEAQSESEDANVSQDEAQDEQETRPDTSSVDSSFNATAQTTYSEIALEALDQDAMVESLVPLYNAADNLTRILAFRDQAKAKALRNDLQVPESRTFKSFQRSHAAVKFHKEYFGDKDYIELHIAIRGLLNARFWHLVGEGEWRADNILELANIAELAFNLLPRSRNSGDAKVTLESLQETFPQNFLTDLSESTSELGGSVLVQETFRFALESRIQYAITQLQEHEKSKSFDPDNIIRRIFYVEEQLRGFNVRSLRTEDEALPDEYSELVAQALQRIRRHFNEQEPFVDFQALNQDFSWTSFLELSHEWIHKRSQELREKVAAQGGADQIQSRLQSEIFRRESPHENGEVSVPLAITATESHEEPANFLPANRLSGYKLTKTGASPLDVMRYRKKLARPSITGIARGNGRVPDSSATPLLTQESDEPANNATSHIPPSAQPEPPSSAYVQSLQTRMEVQRVQGNKENKDPIEGSNPLDENHLTRKRTFLDAQPNRVRESDFTDDEDEFEADNRKADIGRKRVAKPVQSSPPKRARIVRRATVEAADQGNVNAAGVEDDEEHDIQRDRPFPPAPVHNHALTTSARRRPVSTERRLCSSSHPSRTREPNASASTRASSSRQQHWQAINTTTAVPSSSAPAVPSSTAQSVTNSTPSNSQLVSTVNMGAKLVRGRHNERPMQRRRQWTNEEVERLLTLMEDYGTRWANIKKADEAHEDGPLLERRDQVGLKDKARNIKFDYLWYVNFISFISRPFS
ncbi:MAG: hypothetical protein Q9160_006082 [Pyrenula sp. 1 TL-2023]